MGYPHNDYEILSRALRELLEAIDLIEDMTFTRDLEPYKSEAIWDAAVANAKRALKETA